MTSVYPDLGRSEWIVRQRPARQVLDPRRPHGYFLEQELSASNRVCSSGVILLTNKECPWRCLMCDLWKNTLPYTVPPGAIPEQIDYGLDRLGSRPDQIKLYNSGSFFDPASIPVEDYDIIARKVGFAERVIVECHPRLIGKRVTDFRDLLNREQPRILEVAMGLETVHPRVLPLLNKRFNLDDFGSAVRCLLEQKIDCRAFVLVKPPFLNEIEALEWTIKSAEYAFCCGATVVSLIPTRAGNGAMERLIESGEFVLPRLASLERAFEGCLELISRLTMNLADDGKQRFRVFADTWNLEPFSDCRQCFDERRSRLARMNLTQNILPAIDCPVCQSF